MGNMATYTITIPDSLAGLDVEALRVLQSEVEALYLKLFATMQQTETLITAGIQQDELNRQVLEAYGIHDGDEWRQPVGAHDAYPTNAVVTHAGKEWVSLTPGNVWEPGASGWREVAGEDEGGEPSVPEYVQPTGAHDAYKTGDKVTFEGVVYESVIDGNVWTPTAHPAGWRAVTSGPIAAAAAASRPARWRATT